MLHCSLHSHLNLTSTPLVLTVSIFELHGELEAELWTTVTSFDHVFHLTSRKKKKSKQLNLNHAPSISVTSTVCSTQQMFVIVRKQASVCCVTLWAFSLSPSASFCGRKRTIWRWSVAQSHTWNIFSGQEEAFCLNHLISSPHATAQSPHDCPKCSPLSSQYRHGQHHGNSRRWESSCSRPWLNLLLLRLATRWDNKEWKSIFQANLQWEETKSHALACNKWHRPTQTS